MRKLTLHPNPRPLLRICYTSNAATPNPKSSLRLCYRTLETLNTKPRNPNQNAQFLGFTWFCGMYALGLQIRGSGFGGKGLGIRALGIALRVGRALGIEGSRGLKAFKFAAQG